jgi:hypothetical protein
MRRFIGHLLEGDLLMKLGKLLLAVVGATVLLGTLVASASARNLELSQTNTALWSRMDFRGIFGTVECEVRFTGSFHSRTMTKTVNSLIGYITEATVLRCSRGGMTIRQESLLWHRRYRSFIGTLPNITGLTETVTGAEWQIELFGFPCTVRRETSSMIRTYSVVSGTVTTGEVSGTSSCSGSNATLSGATTNVGATTVRLI